MKKCKYLFLSVIVAMLGLSSCTTLSNLDTMDNNLVMLNSANFKYVRTISESSSATYVFGLIGGNPEKEAIEKLKKSANLQPNQAVTNVAITKSRQSIFGIVMIKTITATADIVEFN